MTVKVRFAPSPTGYIHVGNVRLALINWLFARAKGGTFLLRFDDTDLERSKDEYKEAIKSDLEWLGLTWDEMTNQLSRMAEYETAIEKLKAEGRLYPCYETPEELGLKRKAMLNQGRPPIYDRAGLSLTDEQIKAYEAEGRQPHWRFKLLDEPIKWVDEVRGPVEFKGTDLSDPVLIRADGSLLYSLCSVVDDIDLGITHIVRGEDHVANTATHVQLFEALGAKVPEFAHVPLLTDKEGKGLSKRLGSISIQDIRKEGFDPRAVTSLLAAVGTSLTIEAKESLQDLVDSFDFGNISRSTPKFDTDEMARLNKQLLHKMSYEDAQARLREYDLPEVSEAFWAAVQPNLGHLFDVKEWAVVANEAITPAIEDEDRDFLKQAASLLPDGSWDQETWGVWVNVVKEETGRKGKSLFMPLRKALTAQSHGPELKDMLPLIGRDRAIARLSGETA